MGKRYGAGRTVHKRSAFCLIGCAWLSGPTLPAGLWGWVGVLARTKRKALHTGVGWRYRTQARH